MVKKTQIKVTTESDFTFCREPDDIVVDGLAALATSRAVWYRSSRAATLTFDSAMVLNSLALALGLCCLDAAWWSTVWPFSSYIRSSQCQRSQN